MKTAMQQLIDEIVEHLTYDDDLSEDSRITLETIRLRCLGKLLIEKEQIMNAYSTGADDEYEYHVNNSVKREDIDCEKYFNENYN